MIFSKMKQYLTQEQTAKLVELGFEKPKTKLPFEVANDELGYTYSIGELIEMLPEYIEAKGATIDIGFDMFSWVIAYLNIPQEYVYCTSGLELIDALYDMIVRLKEKGVI